MDYMYAFTMLFLSDISSPHLLPLHYKNIITDTIVTVNDWIFSKLCFEWDHSSSPFQVVSFAVDGRGERQKKRQIKERVKENRGFVSGAAEVGSCTVHSSSVLIHSDIGMITVIKTHFFQWGLSDAQLWNAGPDTACVEEKLEAQQKS